MQLKVNFHLHTADDPKDNIRYTTREAIDRAKELGFGALAITCHQKAAYKKEYADYARQKNILLIPGIELRVDNRDVVVLNCDKTAENIKTFTALKKYKNEHPEIFILAPHPFVTSTKSLKSKLFEHTDLFDAIELTIFSNRIFNFNKKARKAARKYNKPLIATSDTHFLKCMEDGYAIIEVENKTLGAIFSAIKKGKLKNKTTRMSLRKMLKFRIIGVARRVSKLLQR